VGTLLFVVCKDQSLFYPQDRGFISIALLFIVAEANMANPVFIENTFAPANQNGNFTRLSS